MPHTPLRRSRAPRPHRAYLEALESRTLFTANIAVTLTPAFTSGTANSAISFLATATASDNSALEGLTISLLRDGQIISSAPLHNGQASLTTSLAAGVHDYAAQLPLNDARPTPGTAATFPTNGNSYEAVPASLTWSDAAAAARARIFNGRRGRLATIASSDEDAFVYSLMQHYSGDFWLGGLQPPNSPEPAGNWQWLTAEPFSYTHWRPGEPNNAFGDSPNEDRISKYAGDGSWLDIPQSFSGYTNGYLVEYPPDLALTGGTSPAVSVEGITTPTITNASPSLINLTYGQSVPVLVTVQTDQHLSVGNSGSVQLRNTDTNSIVLTKPLDFDGTATFTLTAISTGSYHFAFDYLPGPLDAYLPSTSATIPITITTLTPTLTPSSINLTVPYLSNSISSISVNGPIGQPTPTGQVVLRNVATGAIYYTNYLNEIGSAVFTLPSQVVGTTQYIVEYSGSSVYAPVSGTLTVTTPRATPTVQLTLTSNTLSINAEYTTLLVSGVRPEGSLAIFDGNSPIATLTLTNGTAQYSLPTLAPGNHTFSATYLGNDSYTSSTSNAVSYTQSIPTSLSLTSSFQSIVPSTSTTFVVTVDKAISGTVNFFLDNTPFGSTPVVGGKASLATQSITAYGLHTIRANFTPSSNAYLASTATIALTVNAPTTIDLLALYTGQALQAAAGDLFSRIQQSVADANTAFLNSNIPLTLRIVAVAPVSYTESGNLSTDLTRLFTLNDGYLDNVTALRNYYHADLTALFVSDATPSQQLGFETVGIATELFNPAASDRAEDSYLVVAQNHYNEGVLAHEVGHTLGATHAVGDDTDTGSDPYAHGYRFYGNDGKQYHDIMAYDPGTQVPYFSDPSLTYAGVPLGNASTANAARVIRENAPVISAYRSSPVPIGALESATYRTVSGWVLDPKLLFAGAQLQISVDGKPIATLTADQTRSDLNPLFGAANHGFSYTLPRLAEGPHTLAISVLDAETGTPVLIAKRTVTAPTLLFDEDYYLARYPDIAKAVAAGKTTAWDHYRLAGQFELRSPSAYFDASYYLSKNSDLAKLYAAKKLPSPWAHYVTAGQYENRTASPYFDPHFYRLANPDLAAALTKGTIKSLVAHFLTFGQNEGRNPTPYFNTAAYKATLAAAYITTSLTPYQQFLTSGNATGLAPSTWFNPATYLQLNPAVSALLASHTYTSALDHYLRVGKAAGLQFSTTYSESAYLAHNPDIAAAVAKGAFTSGFEHFVLWGYKEGRTAL